jgi:signal transduction histidine kinase
MTATIAHEVNNPLEAILNLGYLLSTDSSLSDEAKGYVDLLLREVGRVGEITKQTLAFHRDPSDLNDVNVKEVLENVLGLQRSLILQKGIEVLTEFDPRVCMWARAGELRQVFANLAINALDVLPTGGQLQIRARQLNRDTVCVVVADNGPGMAVEIRERIFEPFFSTKRSKGTGLGLWVIQNIVRKYDGTVFMRSRNTVKTGTVFRICLPCKPR